MTPVEASKKILDTMLGHLGFTLNIEIEDAQEEPCLQINTNEKDQALLIGEDGDRLDDLQYLVNRILRRHIPDAPRIRVDCGHYRAMQEDKLASEVKGIAQRVRATGKEFKMRPLNAYYRRLVHNFLLGEEGIESHSPPGEDRLKRIIIRSKSSQA